MKNIYSPMMLRKYLASVGMPADKSMYCTEHFSWQELLVNQKELPDLQILENLFKVAVILENYRNKCFKNSQIKITSGWRSEKYNSSMKPKGAKNSLHCKGLALDFVVNGYSPEQIQKVLDPIHKGGLEFAKDWTHIDIRGENIRFDINNKVYNVGEYFKK